MKFGRKINTDLYNEWRPFYLDYNGLKRELKARTTGRTWNDQDENGFRLRLEQELDKIHDFQKEKASELSCRIRDAEKDVKRLVEDEISSSSDQRRATATDDSTQQTDPEAQQRGPFEEDAGSDDDDETDQELSDDESYDALENRFHGLEEEVATLVADVHDLALYTKLNITGFMKILKKHDKQTSRSLKTTFIQDYLEKRPFYRYNWDALIVKLSKLYDLVRTRGHPIQGDSSAGGSQSAFVRQTTKYWVHPDNLVSLKLAILRNLPVLVFNPDKEFEQKDAAITSIYFDNEDLELYLGRLEKTEGAEAIRLRWYGDVTTKTIFVERKTHREDWTGEKSVKARFPIKEHLVNAFLRGEYTMDAEFQQLVKKGKKTQQEVDSMTQLANEVQYTVLTRKLQPVMRSFYNRTAFQLPGDARVRISLDTELTLVREDNWDDRVRAGNNWRRTDIGIDYPFEQLPEDDKELFKYGVLEVKLQTQLGQEPPQWVTDLVQSHLVEAVPKFSKFIHGCATLLPNRVDLVPFWLPQMDTDILKPDTGYLSIIERPSNISSSKGSFEQRDSSDSRTPPHPSYAEPVSEGEEDENMDVAPAKDEHKRTGLSGEEVAAAIAYREQMLKEARVKELVNGKKPSKVTSSDEGVLEADNEEETDERTAFLRGKKIQQSTADRKARALSIDPLAPSSAFDETLRTRLKGESQIRERGLEPEQDGGGGGGKSVTGTDDRLLVREWTAPSGKRISVPVRIEPKVYFATERTFLKWLNMSVFIGTIATTLLNFTSPDDSRGLISAALFTCCALLAIAYSAAIFLYRALCLRQRRAEGLYYDKYGPTILCFVLFSALASNIGLRVSEMIEQH
ncbi:SPX-domain-containing protein [Guyanagaster necrorhizus]|uniref:Vacuolar transporter chaperone complex subunit 4 n=1 Tax=Guyanagaster necrorhizus TaxID=856835 RepID=A0A9P8AXD8_9AGAR|nr:SPX-domain-containing protein [Guyanagaster necrorhizus MCA 3950]KAG7451280.1 SPX-domain-containing protein [Guyanagaster necrorhizus MCA 3950]